MRALPVAVGAVLLALVPAGAARATAPVRTGWWNTVSVSGTAAPATTPDGDLHVALGPNGTLAYAAVSYHVPTYGSAELVLTTDGTVVGTPAVLACPTKDDGWKAGGDQDISTAPAFDCAGRGVTGIVGTDAAGATTLSFLLDPSAELSPGTTSLAIVPAAGELPFSLDLGAPTATSLTTSAVAAPAPAVTQAPVPVAPPAQVAAPLPAVATAPLDSGSAPVTSTVLPPALAPSSAPATTAPDVQAAPPAFGSPVRSGLVSHGTGRRGALALLVLVALGAAYVISANAPTAPRLIGGRAAGGPVDEVPGPARGIGRFNRPRDAPARRLL